MSSSPTDEATVESDEEAQDEEHDAEKPPADEEDDAAEEPPADEEDDASDEEPGEEAVADEPAEEPDAEEEATEAAVEEATADAGIGAPVEIGDLTLTVTEVQTGLASVGDSIWGTEANGEFVVVSFTITNDSSSPESIFSNDFMLLNDAGAEFATSSDAWHVEDSLLWEEINPGNSFTGVLVYDVPAGTNVTGLEVTVGWFSAPVSVDLSS